jgi:hypothetical protein
VFDRAGLGATKVGCNFDDCASSAFDSCGDAVAGLVARAATTHGSRALASCALG